MAIMVDGVPRCECGCGGQVGVWKWTDRRVGHVRGAFKKRIQYHYTGLRAKNPKARRVWEYRSKVERVIGRPLPATAVIHHVNEDRTDNRNENLVVCENDAYHKLLHRRLRAFRACGDANKVKCSFCKEYSLISEVKRSNASRSFYHPACAAKATRERNARKRLAKREKELKG